MSITVARTLPLWLIGLRPISIGNSLPSLRWPLRSRPMPIGRAWGFRRKASRSDRCASTCRSDQDFNISSQQFGSLVAEQFLYARIDQLDPALLVDKDDSVRRGLENNAHVLRLRHNAVDQRVQQCDEGHIDTADENEQKQLDQFALFESPRINRREKQIPGRQRREDCGDDTRPEAPDQCRDDDGRIEGDEGNSSANILTDKPANERGEGD